MEDDDNGFQNTLLGAFVAVQRGRRGDRGCASVLGLPRRAGVPTAAAGAAAAATARQRQLGSARGSYGSSGGSWGSWRRQLGQQRLARRFLPSSWAMAATAAGVERRLVWQRWQLRQLRFVGQLWQQRLVRRLCQLRLRSSTGSRKSDRLRSTRQAVKTSLRSTSRPTPRSPWPAWRPSRPAKFASSPPTSWPPARPGATTRSSSKSTRDGKTLQQDRTIMLTGGQSQELTFDFGGMQLARRRTSFASDSGTFDQLENTTLASVTAGARVFSFALRTRFCSGPPRHFSLAFGADIEWFAAAVGGVSDADRGFYLDAKSASAMPSHDKSFRMEPIGRCRSKPLPRRHQMKPNRPQPAGPATRPRRSRTPAAQAGPDATSRCELIVISLLIIWHLSRRVPRAALDSAELAAGGRTSRRARPCSGISTRSTSITATTSSPRAEHRPPDPLPGARQAAARHRTTASSPAERQSGRGCVPPLLHARRPVRGRRATTSRSATSGSDNFLEGLRPPTAREHPEGAPRSALQRIVHYPLRANDALAHRPRPIDAAVPRESARRIRRPTRY